LNFLYDNFISQFIVVALNFVVTLINDYSITIILFTILLRFALLPLDLKQKKNARMMANLGPELQKLKKRYANDPQQLNAKTQQLYKKNGVSPLAGCLPMLIQLPILFAFFGALRVIASQQTIGLILDASHLGFQNVAIPSWLWIHNFWQPDSGLSPIFPAAADFLSFIKSNMTYISAETLSILQHQNLVSFANNAISINSDVYTNLTTGMLNTAGLSGLNNGWFGLPILAGASLFFQQKFMSRTQGPNDQMANNKFMLWFFPLFSVYICATSTAAFSIYWIAANIYALGQTIVIDKIYKLKQKKQQGTIITPAPSGGNKK